MDINKKLDSLLESFNIYRYKGFRVNLITKHLLDHIINKSGEMTVSLDLGRTSTQVVIEEGKIDLDGYVYDLLEIYAKIDYDKVYILAGGKYGPVAFFENGLYYKLYPVGMYDPPTIEISGIKMHRVVGIKPWDDSRMKVDKVGVKKGDVVLDICTGLGYTAINSLRRGGIVVSVEKDINVLNISKYNPWSQELERIPIIRGDASDIIKDLPSKFFDAIIHDPPRFSLAGELYSLDFYRELYRVLRHRGRLFHYVGEPGIKRGKYLLGGVARRLREVGFDTVIDRSLKGVYAYKF